ncbi:hypothetical protein GCM10023319_74390 [Nocardia iowensis]
MEQLVTIAAVLLGALMSHLTTYMMSRQRNRHELLTRWDGKKLEAYEGFVDKIRATIFAAGRLYAHRVEGRGLVGEAGDGLHSEMEEAIRTRDRAFERVMLLGGDDVVEAAHELNAAASHIVWIADGQVPGGRQDYLDRSRAVFRAINDFHDAARKDLGVQGAVTGEGHPERDLLLPPGLLREADHRD